MAKLILSSCDFRNERSGQCIRENLPKPTEECRVLFFPNEKASENDIAGGKFRNRLAEFGFRREHIRVFPYFSAGSFDFPEIDVLYISGGNTFGTMKCIRESGADAVIRTYVRCGVTYIGGSAGAHIASADIAHVKKYDRDTFGLQDFSGLRLFDGILICHYSEERRADYEELVRQGRYPVTALSDQDSVVIRANEN